MDRIKPDRRNMTEVDLMDRIEPMWTEKDGIEPNTTKMD